jgi:hypothetical protein
MVGVSNKIDSLLKDALDLHVHSGPGLISRSLDHVEASREAKNAGMRGIVVKDQHSMTCYSVYFIKKYVLGEQPFELFGGIVLNNATGGINPYTVDAAIKSGAKIIWMPTSSSENHIETHKRIQTGFPKTKEKTIDEIPLKIVDPNGKLLPQVSQICSLIAQGDVVLGTGHLYLDEIRLLVQEAIDQGVKKILMQHPEFIVDASIEDMIAFADKGVFIEHSMAFYVKGTIDPEYLLEMIRKVGAERTTLGSDLGQVGNPSPVEGFRKCLEIMLKLGVSDEEIDLMIRKNPAKLLNLD